MGKRLRHTADAVVNSGLWAAYGDALGFMTELAEGPGQVRARTGATSVSVLTSWRRVIGGKFGAKVELPAGCYSDDTQLRLATSRAIDCDGSFDVEAFAKIELPVWPSYALGGGLGSKAAAASLANRKVGWSTNFFESTSARYFDTGGNGAAMRVQPHVWASTSAMPADFLVGVLRNALSTHGHPRGLAGAVIHATALGRVLAGDELSPGAWSEVLDELAVAADLIQTDDVLRLVWLPTWESAQHASISESFATVRAECEEDLAVLRQWSDKGLGAYESAVPAIGASDRASRGSGTKTALLAMLLAWLGREEPAEALRTSANALASDTDTIGTMAGALMGASMRDGVVEPPEPPMDRDYIEREARRMWRIASGERAQPDFAYPDLLHWIPPKTQNDAVGTWNGEAGVAGLGVVALTGPEHSGGGGGSNAGRWQWGTLEFGQTVLVKRRARLPKLDGSSRPRPFRPPATVSKRRRDQPAPATGEGGRASPPSESGGGKTGRVAVAVSDERGLSSRQGQLFAGGNASASTRLSVDAAFEIASARGFSANTVGTLLLQLAEQEGGTDLAIAFAALVARSRRRARARVPGDSPTTT